MSLQNPEGKPVTRYIPYDYPVGAWVQGKKTKRIRTIGLRFYSSARKGFRGYNTEQGDRGVLQEDLEPMTLLGFLGAITGITKDPGGAESRLH